MVMSDTFDRWTLVLDALATSCHVEASTAA